MTAPSRIRACVMAVGLLLASGAGLAQSNATLKVYVALVDSDLNVKPVPRHVLLVRSVNGGGDAARLVTGFDGRTEIKLTAGVYILESDRPVDFQAHSYRWKQTITVFDNVPTSIELSNDNAIDVNAAPTPPPPPSSSSAPGSHNLDVKGLWTGAYGDYPNATLMVDRQDGTTFSGTLRAAAKAGNAPAEIQIEGHLSDRAVTLTETKIITAGSAKSWTLGQASGFVQSDDEHMAGSGKAGKAAFRWALERSNPVATQATGTVVPAAAPDLRGAWLGTYAGFSAVLRIDSQDNGTLAGAFVVTIRKNEPPYEVQVTGTVVKQNIELQETAIVKRGVGAWELGGSSGTLSADGKTLKGKKKVGGTSYDWTFTRK